MANIFQYILDLSISASFVAIAVLIFRLLLKKAPRYLTCLLWCLVAIRLLFPFSISSPISIIPSQKGEITEQIHESLSLRPEMGSFWENLDFVENSQENNDLYQENETAQKPISLAAILGIIWIIGVGVMLVAMGISYLHLKIEMASSIPLAAAIRQSDKVKSPFILGILHPVIYLPFGLDDATIEAVLRHEESHLKRGDHLIKPFAYLLLSLHWFNPIMWLSYVFLCRDIEAACDEKVLRDMSESERQSYARALLVCATHTAKVYACPLAFGELNVKGRIKMTLSYKKPVFWIIILAALFAILAAVCVLTDPRDNITKTEEITSEPTEFASLTKKVHWGEMPELTFTSGENNFSFDSNNKVLQEKSLDINSSNWNEPVLAAKSFDDLFHILESCTVDEKLSESTKEAIKIYFNQKEEDFAALYPAADSFDFFRDHLILLFYTPINPAGSINDIRLKLGEDSLDITLQIGSQYTAFDLNIKENPQEKGSLQFIWIAKSIFEKYENGKVTCTAEKSYETDWVRFDSYSWRDAPGNDWYSLSISVNRYESEDAACDLYFGNLAEYKKYRYRIQNYFDITDNRYMIQRAEVPEILPEQPVKLEYEDAYVFVKDGYTLTYDAASSPIQMKEVPDGTQFILTDYLNALADKKNEDYLIVPIR